MKASSIYSQHRGSQETMYLTKITTKGPAISQESQKQRKNEQTAKLSVFKVNPSLQLIQKIRFQSFPNSNKAASENDLSTQEDTTTQQEV